MSEEVKFSVGDNVVGIFNKLNYTVLKVRVTTSFISDFKGEPTRDLYCLCENGNVGWLFSATVKKVEK